MRALAVVACFVCLAPPAFAEGGGPSAPTQVENGRYSMTPTADGFLRLDTRTGAVSLCKVESGAARCQAAIEERTALNEEIDRLARQNEALKARPNASPGLPSQQEFDKALDFAEKFMRRMMRLMREDEPQKDKT
jgi:HAMP domain-containing protein